MFSEFSLGYYKEAADLRKTICPLFYKKKWQGKT